MWFKLDKVGLIWRDVCAEFQSHLTAQIEHSGQKIAEINSQLTRAIVENTKKIAETNSQIAQAQQTLKYGDLHSPASGRVFELKAETPGFVVTPTEPVLKIVPDEALVAKVTITNKDIGFVKEGMIVTVMIDSFPFSVVSKSMISGIALERKGSVSRHILTLVGTLLAQTN